MVPDIVVPLQVLVKQLRNVHNMMHCKKTKKQNKTAKAVAAVNGFYFIF